MRPLLLLAAVCCLRAQAVGAEAPSTETGQSVAVCGSSAYIDVSQPETFLLIHRTVVRLAEPVELLRTFQAHPLEPAWKPDGRPWIGPAEFEPDDAAWRLEPVQGWTSLWERADVKPGTYAFESRTEITTARRELRTAKLQLTWEQVADSAADVPPSQRSEPIDVPEPLRIVAREIRAKHPNPVDALVAVADWIHANIEYSVEVDYGTDDLQAIVRERKGWCGHQYTTFRALCQELGIPVRTAFGYNVRNATGLWNGREDWNRHTWAEVRLPRVGWVEIDPSVAGTPFAIPRTLIKNPPTLQSEAVWIQRDGKWSWQEVHLDIVRIEPVNRKSPVGGILESSAR